jgi:hypothetical protein
MDRELYLSTKRDWVLMIVAIVIIVTAAAQIYSERNFRVEMLFLFAGALFLLFYALMPGQVKLDAAGPGSVDSKLWIFIAYKQFHHEGLSNVKAIVIRKANRWGDVKIDKRILLFADGSEITLPDDERMPEKIVNWFKEVYKISLPITEEIKVDETQKNFLGH